ncbi:MAG: beta strand repeat-containing protein, partial [Solirubrobacteraceae bacterium]
TKDPKAKINEDSQYKTSVSLAIGIADVSNSATTTIGDGAALNAPGATWIGSESAYPWLTNLANLPGNIGQLVGALRGGSAVSLITDLISYSQNAIPALFANGFAQASAQAEKTSIAGQITFLWLTGSAVTNVGDDVSINQNGDNPAGQTVLVSAENINQLILAAGLVLGFGSSSGASVAPSGDSQTSGGAGGAIIGLVLNDTATAQIGTGAKIATGAEGGLSVLASEYNAEFALSQAGASADSTAFGGTVTVFVQNSATTAQIGTGAQITGGPVNVAATSLETAINSAGDITTGHGIGIGVSIALAIINRSTEAIIGSSDLSAPGDGGTNIDISGPLNVTANNDGSIWGFAIAGTVVTKQPSNAPAPSGQGDSGTGASSDPTDEDDPLDGVSLPILFGDSPTQDVDKPQAKTGLAIAGAAAINWVTDTTIAAINDLATINTGTGAVTVSASQTTDVATGTGAIAANRGAGSKNNAALAGALSLNDVNDTTQALLIGASIPTAGSLNVTATRSGKLDSGTVGAAGAKPSGKSVGIAGSVSWDQITANTEALVQGVVATLSGDANVSASDTTQQIAIGGGIAVGGIVGIGASVALNEINQTTQAIVEPLTVGATTTDPSLTVAGSQGYAQSATDGSQIIAVGLSAGIGQSAVAATIAINLGTTSAQATDTDATITTTDSGATTTATTGTCTTNSSGAPISICATDDSQIDAGVGSLALGAIQPSKDPQSAGNSPVRLAIGVSIA